MGGLILKLATIITIIFLLFSLSASMYLFYINDIVNSDLFLYLSIVSLIALGFLWSVRPKTEAITEDVEVS